MHSLLCIKQFHQRAQSYKFSSSEVLLENTNHAQHLKSKQTSMKVLMTSIAVQREDCRTVLIDQQGVLRESVKINHLTVLSTSTSERYTAKEPNQSCSQKSSQERMRDSVIHRSPVNLLRTNQISKKRVVSRKPDAPVIVADQPVYNLLLLAEVACNEKNYRALNASPEALTKC